MFNHAEVILMCNLPIADLPDRAPQPPPHGGERPLRDDAPLLSPEQPVMTTTDVDVTRHRTDNDDRDGKNEVKTRYKETLTSK